MDNGSAGPQSEPATQGSARRQPGRLDSWKDIAAHLKRGVRTVIRWEQEEGLPVHRQSHPKRGTVYAYADELDAWLASRRQDGDMDSARDLLADPEVLSRRKIWLACWAVAALATVTCLSWFFVSRARSPAPVSIAVLPFVNGDSNPALEPLCEGIAETLIRSLSRFPSRITKVSSHSSVSRLKNPSLDVAEAARRLNVNTVLVGNVVERADNLIVTVELINTRDNTQIWSARYERKSADILAIQEEITSEIAAKLPLRLDPSQRQELVKRTTREPAAYRDYLRGRFYWNKRTAEGMATAIAYFEKAIGADPTYALAYAGLADAYALLSYYAPVAPSAAAPKARGAALRALEIDNGSAEAYAALAYVEGDYYWDWAAAERDFKRALQLGPGYADGHHWYGEHLAALGRFPEALAEYRRAVELDPLSLIINTNLAHPYYFSRDYDRTIEQCRQVIALDGSFPNSHADLGRALLLKRRYPEAITELETASRFDGGPINGLGRLGYAYGVSGRRADAQRLIAEMTSRPQREQAPALSIALIYVGLRNNDQALQWLTTAVEQRSPRVAWIKVDPLFDDLRADPRFVSLLRRMNLTP